MKKYVEGALAAGGPEPSTDIWRVCRPFMVTECDAKAEDYIANPDGPFHDYYRYMMSAFAQGGARWLNRPDGREDDNSVDWLDIARDMLAWGSPAAVLDRLIWLREMVGKFGILVMTANEWHDLEIDKHSMRLLAEKVMPRFSQHMLALRGT